MDELNNVVWYEDFITDRLNEDLLNADKYVINRGFINIGDITMPDGNKVPASEIVKVVKEALVHLQNEAPKTFNFGQKTLNIIYLAHSKRVDTMQVDSHMNLYLNAEFVYQDLKMDPTLVAVVLMHEVLHGLYNHIERGKNWLAAKGKPRDEKNWRDTNLAADVEVNQTLVKIRLATEETFEEIHGIYLRGKDLGEKTNVLPLELILDNEDYMNRLRGMARELENHKKGGDQTITTSEEFDKGYKEGWNKLAGLIKKYGYKAVWDKLNDAGICNQVGELFSEAKVEDVIGMEYITLKTYEEFLNESLSKEPTDGYATYEDGFWTAVGKIVESLYDAIYGEDGDDDDNDGEEDEEQGKTNVNTTLKDDDIDPIDLPKKNRKGKKSDGGNKLPNKINNSGSKSRDKDKSDDKSNGRGMAGLTDVDDSELTDDEKNSLANDINDMTNGGTQSMSTHQEMETGGNQNRQMGGFMENGLTKEDLAESGYSEEDVEKIYELIEKNKERNTKSMLNKVINDTKRDLREGGGGFVARMLDKIEVESSKYKNVWKEILEEFMAKETRRAGHDLPNGRNDWLKKNSIAMGEYGVHHRRQEQDPQDVNIYVDVSGSMNSKLLSIIAKSLVVLAQEWEYSGMNIAPWASSTKGATMIEDFASKTEDEIVDEILEVISMGEKQCGFGTETKALLAAMAMYLNDPDKEEKDDVHVVITDGQLSDITNIENKMVQVIKKVTGNSYAAEMAPSKTVWMIYDAPESLKNEWDNEIKKGKIIYIVSDVVINNG